MYASLNAKARTPYVRFVGDWLKAFLGFVERANPALGLRMWINWNPRTRTFYLTLKHVVPTVEPVPPGSAASDLDTEDDVDLIEFLRRQYPETYERFWRGQDDA